MTTARSVLISGAGPTGLLSAFLLARQGVPVRIFDRSSGPVETSRAMGVHARTLEFYDMIGLGEAAAALGSRARTVRLRRKGRDVAGFSIGRMGEGLSPHPYMLTLAQDVHERFLIEALDRHGVSVERDTVLRDVEQDADGVTAMVERRGGTERLRAGYLIGADGGSSATRKALGIGFGGGTSTGLFYVADVKLADETGSDILVGFGADTLALLMPVRTSGMKRVLGIVPPRMADREDLAYDDIRPVCENLLGVRASEVNWFSTYRVHHRVAERFRSGRCFLAGDAGHVHSPVGGQGMNTGLGDAMNLAWKLSDVIHGRAGEDILDTYETERHAFATTLIETTDAAFGKMIAQGWLGRLLREDIAPRAAGLVTKIGAVHTRIFGTVSQIRIAYPQSALSQGAAGKLAGGERLPWVEELGNFAPLDGIRWQVHAYGTPPEGLEREAAALGIPFHRFDWTEAAGRAGIPRDTAHLLRPDGYVGLAGADARGLAAYARRHGMEAPELV